jgi:hypothetical protein
LANDAPLRIGHQNDDVSGVDQPFDEIAPVRIAAWSPRAR